MKIRRTIHIAPQIPAIYSLFKSVWAIENFQWTTDRMDRLRAAGALHWIHKMDTPTNAAYEPYAPASASEASLKHRDSRRSAANLLSLRPIPASRVETRNTYAPNC